MRSSESPGTILELPEAARGILAPFWTSVSAHMCVPMSVRMPGGVRVRVLTHIYMPVSLCLHACVTVSSH